MEFDFHFYTIWIIGIPEYCQEITIEFYYRWIYSFYRHLQFKIWVNKRQFLMIRRIFCLTNLPPGTCPREYLPWYELICPLDGRPSSTVSSAQSPITMKSLWCFIKQTHILVFSYFYCVLRRNNKDSMGFVWW